MTLSINGRTCLYFAVMWGFLGVILIKYVNPLFDKFLYFVKSKIDNRILKAVIILVIGFLIFDAGITTIALKSFYTKIVNDFDLDVKQGEYASKIIENELFEEENMLLTYPNIQIAGTKYNNTSVAGLYKMEKTYYIQVFSENTN